MNNYIIGTDIGATKSHMAIFDTTGTLVDFGYWGPLNHETFPGSFKQFEDEFKQFVTQYLSKNGISVKQVEYSVHGIAGVDTKRQNGIISQIFRKLGFERFTLVNDAFLGVAAGNPSGTGICALNGTGSTLAGINKDGKMLQIGGVGYISADYGGGGMMGKRVVSSVYSELFRRGKPTSMTPVLFNKLGISSKYDFVDKISEKIEDGSLKVNTCAKMLFEAVIENDDVASGILRDIAANYASGISCMIDELKYNREDNLNIIFAGSVFVKGAHPLLLDTIKEKVNLNFPDYRITYTRLEVPPVAGAVIWALNVLNGRQAYYEKVCAQLTHISEVI